MVITLSSSANYPRRLQVVAEFVEVFKMEAHDRIMELQLSWCASRSVKQESMVLAL